MSKSVTIPSSMSPMWTCNINGITYSYTAGSTQTVPDEVADLIENIEKMKPVEATEAGTAGQVWTKQTKGAAWADVPVPESFPTFDLGNAPLIEYGNPTTYEGIGAFITANTGKPVILKNFEVVNSDGETVGWKSDILVYCSADIGFVFNALSVVYQLSSAQYYLYYTATDKLELAECA